MIRITAEMLHSPGRQTFWGVPEGHDANVLAQLVRRHGGAWLHVAADDVRLSLLADLVSFFDPELTVIRFPAWDCLPYDRVSPHGGVVGQRVEALSRLSVQREKVSKPVLVLTTVNAVTQRVPPPELFAHAMLDVGVGERLDMQHLHNFLVHNGYHRTETVREPGEYAIRGGLVDLFPPAMDEPVRLDMFGDEVESIRSFDAMTQRSTGQMDTLVLRPVSEIFLDEKSIARFRSAYRETFGAVREGDALYEAISEGRRHGGMEHWLPLFFDHMATLLDYLPQATPVSIDHNGEAARVERQTQVEDFYAARLSMMQAAEKGKTASGQYKPLPVEKLYINGDEWQARLDGRCVLEFSPFAAPEVEGVYGAGGRKSKGFRDVRAAGGEGLYEAVVDYIRQQQKKNCRVLLLSYSQGARDRLIGVLAEHGIDTMVPVNGWNDVATLDKSAVGIAVLGLNNGYIAPGLAVITEQDILGDRLARPVRRKKDSENFIREVSSLNTGDLVVHAEHGVGRFEALETLEVAGGKHDCLKIVYEGGDKLFVPVENIEVLSRYGSEDAGAPLDKLGGAGWQARKARVKKDLLAMADKLLEIAARREMQKTEPITVEDSRWAEFCARFPYPETDDQLRSIGQVIDDLAKGRAMDRLVCGDVGFGKTEIALRAAFAVAMAGYQVAVVVPTTLLARQHFKTFVERFKGMPLRIQQLSRLVKPAEAKRVREGLADGSVNIVVGTHAILGKKLQFNNLGLVVVDEEQHFGVKQKERLKELRSNVHVLTLTATPIPRTLQLALTGVRELSLITTPPVDRLAIRTFVLPYDAVIIREALMREHFRGGQSFYVCPRIADIEQVYDELRELVPEVRVITAHGQMPADDLEDRMTAFYDGKYDVLLATNIIESGLDIPNANTMIVHRADMFGLAQLYQIRGRIGRSKQRAYAYLTYQAGKLLNKNAEQRLQVIETLDSLGAGFELASHDLDIRGAGNLLGEEQSGHIREVGIELYQQMLEEAVAMARAGVSLDEVSDDDWTPQINLGTSVLIPETYVEDLHVRLSLYRRIAELVGREEIEGFAAELIDRFGPLPQEVDNLLETVAIKQKCKQAGIEKIEAGPKGAVITFRNNRFEHVDRLVMWMAEQAGTVKLRPDEKLVVIRSWKNSAERLRGVRSLTSDLAKLSDARRAA